MDKDIENEPNFPEANLPFDFISKKDEKIKLNIYKRDSNGNNLLGTSEIALNNSKGKKEIVTKKWFNINLTNSNKDNKKDTARKTHNHLNFAVNLVNMIKINFKITENYDMTAINNFNTSKQNDFRNSSFGAGGNFN